MKIFSFLCTILSFGIRLSVCCPSEKQDSREGDYSAANCNVSQTIFFHPGEVQCGKQCGWASKQQVFMRSLAHREQPCTDCCISHNQDSLSCSQCAQMSFYVCWLLLLFTTEKCYNRAPLVQTLDQSETETDWQRLRPSKYKDSLWLQEPHILLVLSSRSRKVRK